MKTDLYRSRASRHIGLLVAAASCLLLVFSSTSSAGQNCVGPKPISGGFLNWVKKATARAARGVMVEEAKAALQWTFPICGAPQQR